MLAHSPRGMAHGPYGRPSSHNHSPPGPRLHARPPLPFPAAPRFGSAGAPVPVPVPVPRSEKGRSYVCDVNGWSFVKNSKKYYDDAAGILRSIILSALAPHRLNLQPHLPARLHGKTNPETGSTLVVGGCTVRTAVGVHASTNDDTITSTSRGPATGAAT